MGHIEERLDHVRTLIQEPEFLEGKGLSNEVNIRIFCYEPEDEMAVRHFVEQLETDHSLACRLKICNLYQTFLSVCEDMDIIDAIPDMEAENRALRKQLGEKDEVIDILKKSVGILSKP